MDEHTNGKRTAVGMIRMGLDPSLDSEGIINVVGGKYAGAYPIITTKSRKFIGGISIGATPRPAILVDDSHLLADFYKEALSSFRCLAANSFKKDEAYKICKKSPIETLKEAIDFRQAVDLYDCTKKAVNLAAFFEHISNKARCKMGGSSYDSFEYKKDAEAWNQSEKYALENGIANGKDVVLPLSFFIEQGKGVCIHRSLLMASALEKMVQDNIIGGQIKVARFEIGNTAHAFVQYCSGNEVYNLDATWSESCSKEALKGQF